MRLRPAGPKRRCPPQHGSGLLGLARGKPGVAVCRVKFPDVRRYLDRPAQVSQRHVQLPQPQRHNTQAVERLDAVGVGP